VTFDRTTIGAAAREIVPGVLVCATIAMAATFISDHHGGPTLLYALLIGMAFHSLTVGSRASEGIGICSGAVLRFGVALLGVRISLSQIGDLGWSPIILVVAGVAATIGLGAVLSRLFGLSRVLGVLTGGAVAICGASAALAISAVLPADKDKERDTLFTVVAVTVLGTVAMVIYPLAARALGLGDHDAGLLFGATIHDVAQVVAAGHIISDEAGLVATYTKLLRVALLFPVVLGLAWLTRGRSAATPRRLLPVFLVAFAALVVLNSAGLIPAFAALGLAEISRWCLVGAIAALGMKTSMADLARIGWKPLALVSAETLFLLGLVGAGLWWLSRF
jgi:uncharacterized integral membrane protein (TIGR00698 family)